MTNEQLKLAKKTAETFNATLSVLVENDFEDIEHFCKKINQVSLHHLLVYSRKFLKEDADKDKSI